MNLIIPEDAVAPVNFPHYRLSRDGRLFSLHRGKTTQIKPVLQENGYLSVTLTWGNRVRVVGLHRLMAETFLGPSPGKNYVPDHKDFDRVNNHIDNIEWITQSENVQRAYDAGRRVIDAAHRERCGKLGIAKRKLTQEQAVEIRAKFAAGAKVMQLSREYGINHKSIGMIVRNELYAGA